MILSFLGVYQAGYLFSLMGIVLALGNGCLLFWSSAGFNGGVDDLKTKRPTAAARRRRPVAGFWEMFWRPWFYT